MPISARHVVITVFLAGVSFAAGAWFTQRPVARGSVGAGERKALRYICPMHPQYTSDRPGDAPCCGMRLEPVYAEGTGAGGATPGGATALPPGVVRVTPEKQQVVGVRVGEVETKPVTRLRRTVGRVAADETRLYRIAAATAGWIEEALPNTAGSLVRRDERLARFYVRDIAAAQQAYFYALDAHERFARQNATETQVASTNVQLQTTVDSLRALGMSPSQIDEIGRTRTRVTAIDIRSPATGVILTRNVSHGQRFEPGDEMYVIADLRRVWVLADLFEDDRRELTVGRKVSVRALGETFEARVSGVPPTFDPDARTMSARLELENPGYRLRPGMFVDVEFQVDIPETLTVPADAVVDSGLRKTVFVDRGHGLFEPRHVEIGRRLGDTVEIKEGLAGGERIVVSGTFLIDSESRMKAAAQGVFGETAEDPVCGMQVDKQRAKAAGRTHVHGDKTYFFCADACLHRFANDPGRYLKRPVAPPAPHHGT